MDLIRGNSYRGDIAAVFAFNGISGSRGKPGSQTYAKDNVYNCFHMILPNIKQILRTNASHCQARPYLCPRESMAIGNIGLLDPFRDGRGANEAELAGSKDSV